ncbi:MAG: monofunctional biosynthetic peptidoglycan transglycosylase [Nevskiaceae bacterium]|nr:MAG: monofunctional biosynthetic peptidoglycan transglycosylase [Nevskiaceae bacterium]
MKPRHEPRLELPAGPLLPVAPSATAAAVTRRRRIGLLGWLWRGLLLAIALPLLTVLALKWLPPPTTAFMLQSPVRPVRYDWVPADRIADSARRAVIAAEDQKFRMHHGFDVEAIQKAVAHNRSSRHRRGASTISQQTAKNLFLWPGGGYFRKAVEAGVTVLIETIWGKDRILEVYLNVAEFGPGIYGVEAASQAYFHKHAAQLTPGEASRLAAVLPNPRHWSVTAPGAYVQARAGWILGQMGYGGRSAPAEEPEPPVAAGAASEAGSDDDAGPALGDDTPAATPPAESPTAAPAGAATPQAPQTEVLPAGG